MAGRGTLHGTRSLIRFTLRRDRVWLSIWIVAIVAMVVLSASSVEGLYPTQEDLDSAAQLIEGNTAIIALNGPAQGLDTIGGRVVFEVGAFGYVIVALMNLFLVGRHTRAEEETGRAELTRAAPVGRHAAAAATLLVAVAANLAIGALSAAGFVALGLGAEGSVAFGAALAACGLVFAAVTAVACQVSEHTRAAYGLAGLVLGASYVLRAVGDAGNGVLSWLSPIGWGQAVRPFADERWWVLLLPLTATLLCSLAAVWLASHRDLGAGLVQPKPGRPTASAATSNPFGLALRLQRASLLAWAAGLALAGVAYGAVGKDIADFVGDNEAMADMLAQAGGVDITDSYFATTALMLAIIGSGFAISSALRPRSEEVAQRCEPLLATGLARWRWLGSHLLVALGGTSLVALAAGIGTGAAYAASVGDAGQVLRLAGAALVQVPAMWVLVGIAAALFGLLPKASSLAWVALALSFVVGMLGELFSLPGWIRDLSPFQHVPQVPAASVDVVPLVVLTLVAAALLLAGQLGFRRRDIG